MCSADCSSSDSSSPVSPDSRQLDASADRRRGHPKSTSETLKKWIDCHRDNPYPNDDEKNELCRETQLTRIQLNNWFINARRRYLPGKAEHDTGLAFSPVKSKPSARSVLRRPKSPQPSRKRSPTEEIDSMATVEPTCIPESVPSPICSDCDDSSSSSDSDSSESQDPSPMAMDHSFERPSLRAPKMFAALLEVVDREWCAIYQGDEERMET